MISSASKPGSEERPRSSSAPRNSPTRVVLADEPVRRATPRENPLKSDVPPGSAGTPSRRAIALAVARATRAATSCSQGPESGRVEITFAPSGGIQAVRLLRGFGETGINACVLRAMGRAKVPAFSGEPVSVRKTVTW